MFFSRLIFDVQSAAHPAPNGVESCKMEKIPPVVNFPFFNKFYIIVEDHMECLMAYATEKLVAEHSSVESDLIATELAQILCNR